MTGYQVNVPSNSHQSDMFYRETITIMHTQHWWRDLWPATNFFLPQYLAERRHATTEAAEMIISNYFPAEFWERKKLNEEEMAELAK